MQSAVEMPVKALIMIKQRHLVLATLLGLPILYIDLIVICYISKGVHFLAAHTLEWIFYPAWDYYAQSDRGLPLYNTVGAVILYLLICLFLFKTLVDRAGAAETSKTVQRLTKTFVNSGLRYISWLFEFSFRTLIRLSEGIVPNIVRMLSANFRRTLETHDED